MVRVAVFDAYGTLFDVAAAARRAAGEPAFAVLAPHWAAVARDWRLKQLQYTWLRAITGVHADFWQVTRDGLDWALEAAGLTGDEALRQRLLALYHELDAYPEVPAMLGRLKAAGLKTAILSNGEPNMLEAAISAAGLSGLLDQVLSVDGLKIYKPDPSVYQLAVDRLGVRADSIAFQSSNAWDVHGAAVFGFRPVWINRFDAPAERLPGGPEHVMRDLAGLPDLLGI
jgi:2-haloacid dehalogenase